MHTLSASVKTTALPRIKPAQAKLSPELDPSHAVGRGILHRAERTTDPALADRLGWFLHSDEEAREFLRLSQEVKNRSKQASTTTAADQGSEVTAPEDTSPLPLIDAAESVEALRPEIDPQLPEGKEYLRRNGYTTEENCSKNSGLKLISTKDAIQILAENCEYKRRRAHEEECRKEVLSNWRRQSRRQGKHVSRRGRPRKDSAVPGVYGNRKLDRCLQQAGLTATERTIARKILSILRAEHLATGRGKFIQRSSLGSERTVKRTFSKLRTAQLITDSRPVKGQNQTRLTNLGPAFLGGLTGQPDGPKLAPQNRNFDTTKTIANTGKDCCNLAPRFSHPLKEGSYGAGPVASAPLRASASGPPPSPIHTEENQIHSEQADQKEMTECNQNRSLDYGSVIRVKGHQGLYLVKGLSWGDTADDDSVRCVSLDNPSDWLECKQRDTAVAD